VFCIKFEKFIDYKEHYYILTEYIDGGELLDRLLVKKKFTEPEARILFGNILLAVEYMHAHHILHRDLKLDNILMNSKENDRDIKIIDFNISMETNHTEILTRTCGTLEYMAPELKLKKGYSFPVDIWSSGVILYALLSGKMPFDDNENFETYKGIVLDNEWDLISSEA